MAATKPVTIPEFDVYLFGRGEHWDIYRILGAHPHEQDGEHGYRFAVWAPNAQEINIAGDFNEWRWGEFPLYPVASSGIWAGFLPGMEQGVLYKIGIKDQNGRIVYKTDPYALHTEMRPGNAARTWTLDGYEWNDEQWMRERREKGLPLNRAVSIYEVHPGSWRRKDDGGFLSYNNLADQLIPYVKQLGFTHIQLMPVAEHPLDESWGYQTSHYFAPTSRFGAPDDFRTFVDRCHGAGLGVLLDWVPGHFPKDEWCLGRFDGTAVYEHSDPRQGEHPDWGTYIFNYGRSEVRNFLFANALYWLKEFHIDGIRIDAVASMLYLDYSREEGEWVPNMFGGRENLEAIDFLKELNRVVHEHYPGAIMVAEESTAWAGVSRPLYVGGLGFTFKWNMGWMHDTLEYFSKDPIHRAHHQNTLTFSMLYAFTENFVLPLSHDEVVHGKGALLSKMPGDMWQQQANLRLLYSYQWAHPGKKLLFMGGEFGQWNEWKESGQLDWVLMEFPTHQGIARCLTDLNRILVDEPAMHCFDHDWQGFQWLDFSDYANSVLSFMRLAPELTNPDSGETVFEPAPSVIWVFNFTPVVRKEYVIPAPHGGLWREIFNSDSSAYGGSNTGNAGLVDARYNETSQGWGLNLTLPPLAAMAFKPA
ncbi:1,4-alpha-glucan branching protein GlgB [Oceanidesulfovibrio marinus]|uniref:1,4-alpha-glucan branching enzyme GlgB n=1 Tax=Oceanidesulfovibrio marinus TaxID=370038 RepID=A0A6P1ZLC7_9BACT|nr:1,4-alpha-glucan branching protein GlgB [Oceanidesulfovibrio marinus]TVM34546.1 1,4-alpha-glucan branching enzyme [Oceanidesulfovibrio marinus]